MFFSDYGSFMHKLIELYLRGFLEKEELTGAYVSGFRRNVRGKAPSSKIFKSYFDQGYDYLSEIDFPYLSPIGVEQKVDFHVGDKPFTGIIDCVAMDDGKLVILDNKSRALKPRSGRQKPTVSDAELDSYLRQLYGCRTGGTGQGWGADLTDRPRGRRQSGARGQTEQGGAGPLRW